ncbi:hypothetical protein EVAR_55932_1 [Eumeta japonica]|uniref:Uncharacterized protein n=1 Tax=Eumeta variegata TaxID=151549 RepID=A0A4C1YZ78_EUMVA|nr:hypothetical protein EVAR_55932_1 [Eumeta japonica]
MFVIFSILHHANALTARAVVAQPSRASSSDRSWIRGNALNQTNGHGIAPPARFRAVAWADAADANASGSADEFAQQLASRWHWLYRRYCACVIPLCAPQSGDSCLLRLSALGHLLFVFTSWHDSTKLARIETSCSEIGRIQRTVTGIEHGAGIGTRNDIRIEVLVVIGFRIMKERSSNSEGKEIHFTSTLAERHVLKKLRFQPEFKTIRSHVDIDMGGRRRGLKPIVACYYSDIRKWNDTRLNNAIQGTPIAEIPEVSIPFLGKAPESLPPEKYGELGGGRTRGERNKKYGVIQMYWLSLGIFIGRAGGLRPWRRARAARVCGLRGCAGFTISILLLAVVTRVVERTYLPPLVAMTIVIGLEHFRYSRRAGQE